MRKLPRRQVENVGALDFNPSIQQKQAKTMQQKVDKRRKEVLKTTLLAQQYRMIFRKDA